MICDKISQIKSIIHKLTAPTTTTTTTLPVTLNVSATEFVPPQHPTVREPPAQLLTPPPTARQPISRLPKLNLPNFSGSPLAWQSFWDSFDAAVNSNTALDGIQKFNYLRAQIQGEASQAIAGLPLTGANYDHAVALLKVRFGQPHRIINAHMQALVNTPKPVNTLPSLRLFHDTVESHIRGLTALDKREDSYGALLVPIIVGKLPPETRRNLARAHTDPEWTVTDLQDGILLEIQILEQGVSLDYTESSDNAVSTMTASLLTGASSNFKQRTQSAKPAHCTYCNSTDHLSFTCNVVVDPEKRMEIVRKANPCFNCLGRHRISQCRSKARCRHCRGKHHSSLCETTASKDQDNTGKKATASTVKQNNYQDDSTASLTVSVPSKPPGTDLLPGSTACRLKTAIAEVCSGPNHSKAQILFDEGAQRSFITQQLADSLKVDSCKRQRICISAFGGEAIPRELQSTSIVIQTNDSGEVPVSVLVVPKIAAPLQNAVPLPGNQYPHLHGLQLARPMGSDNKFEITLLVGADFYWNLVQDKIIRGNGPTAVESKIGYLLSGPLSPSDTKASVRMFHTSVMQCNEPKFWDTDTIGHISRYPILTKQYTATHLLYQLLSPSRFRWFIHCWFPWKTDHPPLPSNRGVCEKRAQSLARKLAQTPELLKTYGAIITDQLSRGFIEKVKEADVPQNCHFIPHHAVKKDSSTTPVRIVYDCSCRLSPNHPSLNDCLVVGPPFLIDMVTLLLRFHTHKYALTTDIEKAFLHVQLAEEDHSCTHFLWLSELDNPNSDLTIFRFRVVLFGSVSSPFMLHTALRHHLTTETSTTASDILTNLYVDNVVSGCTNETSAVDYYTEARELMSKANFNLRSWASNSPNLMTKANHDQVADTNTAVNVLGLLWNTASDTLSLMPKSLQTSQTTQPTKRTVLQDLSKIFDPLGTLTPVTISAKLFMQQLWQQKLRWNEPLNSTLTSEWHCITGNLTQTPQYHIPRWYLKSINTEQLTLHVFVDASMKAYGAVAYICDDTHSSFAIAKARVAPLKNHTLPPLELMAAVTGSRLCKFVISLLDRFQFKITMWSDSQIALCWISNKKKLPPFVANRVNEIHDLVPTATWMYCPTQVT